MEKFTLGRKKIGDHFYDFHSTETSYSKTLAIEKRLEAKGLVVKIKNQKVAKKNVWIIHSRPDKRRKKKPATGRKPSKKPVKSGKSK